MLYQTTDASRFKAQEFLNARQSFSRDLKIVCEGDDIDLSNDAAMPLALIVNELFTNALKRGVDASGDATVRVGLMREGRYPHIKRRRASRRSA